VILFFVIHQGLLPLLSSSSLSWSFCRSWCR
jgi:hypothetical protein